MKDKKNKNIFTFTSSLKILSFLAEEPEKKFLGKDIQKAIKLSRVGVYLSAKELAAADLIKIDIQGKIRLYSFNYANPISKQYKILLNLILIKPLVVKLQEISKTIILYGSASRGEDAIKSDIDLFILSHDPEAVRNVITDAKMDFKKKIQAIIKNPVEYSAFKDKEKVYAAEVDRGIVLWEGNND